MGRDKALLPHPVSGRPLLEHQAALLRSLAGCAELLLSAPAGRGYPLLGPLAEARLVEDTTPDCGPLAGIAAGLGAASTARLLVLAVDLPSITPGYLEGLLWRDAVPPKDVPHPRPGLAPRHGDGAFEPLCALYPVSPDSRAAVAAALARRELSLQRLLVAACGAGWMRARPIPADERPLFANWNAPGDLTGQGP
jgi:molybdopterin-guanine dinucleotide biosynthesis protein A